MTNRIFFITILLLFTSNGASMAGELAPDGTSDKAILIDVVKGKIGDVNYRDSIDTIRKAIGTSRIKNLVEELEGTPHNFYEIDISGHKIYKHWNGTSLEDPAFKIKSGLGVGASVEDFRKVYGKGKFIGGEGIVNLCFESREQGYSFCISDLIEGYEDATRLNEMTVRSLWIR